MSVISKLAGSYNRLGFPDPVHSYGFFVPGGQYQAHLTYDCPNLDIRDFLDHSDTVISEISDRVDGRGGGSQHGSRINLHFFLEGV